MAKTKFKAARPIQFILSLWISLYLPDNVNSFQEHKKAETAYYWLYFLLGILIPLILLAFCNAMLIKALRESMKMRQLHSSTSTRWVNTHPQRGLWQLSWADPDYHPEFLMLGRIDTAHTFLTSQYIVSSWLECIICHICLIYILVYFIEPLIT